MVTAAPVQPVTSRTRCDLVLPQPTVLPPWAAEHAGIAWSAETPRPDYTYDRRLSEYDAFFGITRAHEMDETSFSSGLRTVYRSLLDEAELGGTRLAPLDWSTLCSVFQEAIGRCSGPPNTRVDVTQPPAPGEGMDPGRRWLTGHRVFFALTQCLIVALQSFATALSTQDIHGARRELRLAARLLDGSAVAFRFTGEFSAQQYEHEVRPSMEPPHVSAGFSGLLSPDHLYLVRLFTALKQVLQGLPATELAADHQTFVSALRGVYATHKHVCSRFGGDTEPSLRTSGGSGKAAVAVLDGLQSARTRSVSGA